MTEWERQSRMAKVYKEMYPAGARIVLEHMGDDPRPIAPGTRGTVRAVDDIGTIHCDFDNGRHLGLIPGEDSFRKLTLKELEEEQSAKDLGSVDDLISDASHRNKNADTLKPHAHAREDKEIF